MLEAMPMIDETIALNADMLNRIVSQIADGINYVLAVNDELCKRCGKGVRKKADDCCKATEKALDAIVAKLNTNIGQTITTVNNAYNVLVTNESIATWIVNHAPGFGEFLGIGFPGAGGGVGVGGPGGGGRGGDGGNADGGIVVGAPGQGGGAAASPGFGGIGVGGPGGGGVGVGVPGNNFSPGGPGGGGPGGGGGVGIGGPGGAGGVGIGIGGAGGSAAASASASASSDSAAASSSSATGGNATGGQGGQGGSASVTIDGGGGGFPSAGRGNDQAATRLKTYPLADTNNLLSGLYSDDYLDFFRLLCRAHRLPDPLVLRMASTLTQTSEWADTYDFGFTAQDDNDFNKG